jgi:glycosyltransferase involved in cell wall biosynthesis
MEAMAMEVPVVVTRGGGVEELVRDGVDGIFVVPEQPVLLADALGKLARNPDLAYQLGRHGRNTIEVRFQASRSADVLAKHILEQANRG